MTNPKELHVIFGTGPLGRAVMRELLSRNQSVRMVNRSGVAGVPLGVEVVKADAYDTEKVKQVTAGAAVAYQCAQPAYQDWVERFPSLQASIVTGVAASNAKLIVAENLYMYGAGSGPMREDSPCASHTRKGRVRAAMSEALLEAYKAGTLRVAMGRGSDFFGPEVMDSAIGARAIYPALAGKSAGLIGNIDLPHTLTFVSDFGKALVILGEQEAALGQAWHVPNAPTVSQRYLMILIFEEIGLPSKMHGMGDVMMRVGGLFNAGARETVEMMYEFEQPFVADSTKFESAFGMQATPMREAVKATVAWYRNHPRPKH